MAKDADKKTGAFELENTGGFLSGLLAEENEFDRRALLRIGTWGVSAVGAVILAVVANHWSPGLRQEQVAAADLARQAQQIQALSRETNTETRRLASAIETLNNDRDRLFSRVTVLEQGLDSVTGALAKQTPRSPPAAEPSPRVSAVPYASPPSALWPSAAKLAPLPAAPQIVATAAPAPVLGPVTTMAPAADKPRAHDSQAIAAIAPAVATPAAAASLMAKAMIEAPAAAPKAAEATKATEVKAAAGKALDAKAAGAKAVEMKAPEMKMAEAKATDVPAARRPEPASSPVPERAAPASPHASDEPHEAAAKVDVQRTDFAVELGSANSLPGLRALWHSVQRLNPGLAALNPIIVIKEGNNGLGMKLHLAAGPLNDAAAAAKICAAMAEHKRICETTVYDGQRLALKDEGDAKEVREAREPREPKEAREAKQPIKLLHEGKQNPAKRKYVKKEEPPPPPPPPPSAPPPPDPPKPEPKSPFAALFGHH